MRGRTNAVSGTVLPELSNPAGAANIQSGYQAINGEGEVVTGTAITATAVDVRISNYSGNVINIFLTTHNGSEVDYSIADMVTLEGSEEHRFSTIIGALCYIYIKSGGSSSITFKSYGGVITPIKTSGDSIAGLIRGSGQILVA